MGISIGFHPPSPLVPPSHQSLIRVFTVHVLSVNSVAPFLFIFLSLLHLPAGQAFHSLGPLSTSSVHCLILIDIYPYTMVSTLSSLLALAALAGATPLRSRVVDSLNEAATEEAHQRDDGATRAFSGVEIKVRIPQRVPGSCLQDQLTLATDV